MNDVETIRPPFDPAVLYKALFLAVVAIFVLVPLLATVLGGFKSLGELRVNPFGLPHQWEWSELCRHPVLQRATGSCCATR